MKWMLFLIALFTLNLLSAQNYYYDIVANRQSNAQFVLLKTNGVNKVKAFNYDAQDKLNDSFNIEQILLYDTLFTNTAIPNQPVSVLASIFKNNRLVSTEEFAENIRTNTQYNYNAKGLLDTIASITTDTINSYTNTEKHCWKYNPQNQPVQMLKIKNKKDTLQIEFKPDENGNVGEEHWFSKVREIEIYYYYHNNKRQLTDVVRYSTRKQKMIPDYMFEYNAQGSLSHLTQLTNGGANYFIWTYTYKPNGLKEREVCRDNNDLYVGKIEYGYQQ